MATKIQEHQDDRWRRVSWGASQIDFASVRADALEAAARTGWPLSVLLDPNIPLPDFRHIPLGLLEARIRARLDAGGFIRR